MMLPKKRGKFFYGWWIVVECCLLNFFVGGAFYYGFTAFFDPLRNEFGWTSAETALGFSLQKLEGGIMAPFVGFIFDRIGPRKLILSGMFVAGSGLIVMSYIDSLTEYYVAFLMMSVGISFAWLGPPMYVVNNWFIRKRAKALSFLMAASGLGGLLVPILVLLISQAGWRTGMLAVGIGFWVVSIPMAIVGRHRPEQCGYLPDGDTVITSNSPPRAEITEVHPNRGYSAIEMNFGVPEAIRTRTFWLISLSFMLSQFVATAVMVLEMPHLENIGIYREVAGLAVTFTTLLSLVGSLASGVLGDMIKKTYIIAGGIAMQCLGMVLMANIYQPWHLIPFIIAYGVGYGATLPMRPAIMADYFGRSNIGTIIGLMTSISLIGSAMSPVVAGWFFGSFANYRGIFITYAVGLFLGIPAILLARHPPPRKQHLR